MDYEKGQKRTVNIGHELQFFIDHGDRRIDAKNRIVHRPERGGEVFATCQIFSTNSGDPREQFT
jgi:hypothetical protein